MQKNTRTLERQQIDETFRALKKVFPEAIPRRGWIWQIRHALMMTAAQLAKKMNVGQPNVSTLEASEAEGTITINSLRKAAAALNCELVYALVPRQSLEQTIRDRARQLATDRVNRVAQTMKLEDQTLPAEYSNARIDELSRRLEENPPRNLWD